MSPSGKIHPYSVLCILLLAAALESAAINVREPRNVRHDRILSSTGLINRNFIFYDYDVSGIAINQNTLADAGRATMITPQHFVTSSHTAGTHPGSVRMMNNNGIQHVYTVSHYDRILESNDLTIGTLAQPIPAEHGIAHYPVALVNPPDYDGAMIGIFAMRQLAGINRLEGSPTAQSEFFNHDYDIDSTDAWGRGGDEAKPVTGDSGHAMVAAYAGRLFLLGTHYTSAASQSVPKHIGRIQEIVGMEGFAVEVVETLPRIIADFNPSQEGTLFQNGGILGGTIPADPSGSLVGRIRSSIGVHHLYAASEARRPILVEGPQGEKFLEFDGERELVVSDTDQGTVQAFMFELNTEQPRVYLVARMNRRDSGVSTLLEMRYSSGPSSLSLVYDHATKRLRAEGMGASVEVPQFEETWFLAELIRERQTVALSVNAADPVTGLADPEWNDDTDFESLSVGSSDNGANRMFGGIGRIVFTDTGDRASETLRESLLGAFSIQRSAPRARAIEPDPAGGYQLHFDLQTSANPDGPYSPVQLRESAVSVVDGLLQVSISRGSVANSYLKINTARPVAIPTGDVALSLQLQQAAGPGAAWSDYPVLPEAVRIDQYRLILQVPAAGPDGGFYRLVESPR